MKVFCDECKRQINTKVKDFSLYSKILCSECTDKFDWDKEINYYIFSEKNFKPGDSHLFVISFCSNCHKPKIMRKDKIINGLDKYGYHLCDKCNRIRQANKNLEILNGENWHKIHSTEKCIEAYRKQALSNLQKINTEEGIKRRKDNGTFERAHKTRLKNGFYSNKFGIAYRFCEKCGKETLHNGMICKICHPEVLPGNPKTGEIFREKWKDKDYREHMLKILKERWETNPILGSPYIRDENGYITHINNISIKEWYSSIQNRFINFNEENFIFIPTGRTQKSNKRNSLLDDYLVKENITWFVYIKFDELGHPLVAGKSGSRLVNSSGCDVIFDRSQYGGPARQYLIENNIDWDKTQIAIYRCDTEKEAYKKEKEIQEKYNLFGS